MKGNGLTLIILWSVVMTSCTFEPDDINVIDIDTSNLNFPKIEISNIEDTVYWRGSKSFSFSIEEGFNLYGIQIILDSHVLYEGQYSPSLVFDSKDFSNGFHKLIFRTYTKSYTGSIADNLNSEALIAEYIKICNIDNRPIIAEVSGFTNESGVLQLNWNPYGDFNFDKYQFKWQNGVVFWESNDVNANALSFPDFVGGEIKGTFQLYAKGEVVSLPITFKDNHEFDVTTDQNNTYLSLRPVDYIGIESIQLRLNYSLNGDLKQLTIPLEIREYVNETIDLPVIFPSRPLYQLVVNSEVQVAEENLTESQILPVPNLLFLSSYQKGENILSFYKHPYEFRDRDEVFLIDAASGNIINQLKGNFCLSPNGNILYQRINNLVLRLDPNNFNVIEVVRLEEEFEFQGSISKIIVSNTNVLFVLIQNSGPIGSSDFTGYSWDRNNFEMISIAYYDRGINPDIHTTPSAGSVLTASGKYIINEPANYYQAPYFDPLVFSSQDNLVNDEGPIAPLLSTDNYLEGSGSMLNLRDYQSHTVQSTVDIGYPIVQMFSNYDDLVAAIIENNNGLTLKVINSSTFEILSERTFNEQALDGEIKMRENTVFIRFGNETFKWNIYE